VPSARLFCSRSLFTIVPKNEDFIHMAENILIACFKFRVKRISLDNFWAEQCMFFVKLREGHKILKKFGDF